MEHLVFLEGVAYKVEPCEAKTPSLQNTIMLLAPSLLLAWVLHSAAWPVQGRSCPIIFDGRVPSSFTPADFDTDASPFNTDFVHGESEFPNFRPSFRPECGRRSDLGGHHQAAECFPIHGMREGPFGRGCSYSRSLLV